MHFFYSSYILYFITTKNHYFLDKLNILNEIMNPCGDIFVGVAWISVRAEYFHVFRESVDLQILIRRY